MKRPRQPRRVRQDAIRLAIQKGQEGCTPCARQYFALAKQNGASDEEIQEQISAAGLRRDRGLTRRQLLKLAGVGAAGIALGKSAFPADTALAYSFYYGTDTNTVRGPGTPPGDFYIGKAGGGTSQSWMFSTSAANLAGYSKTYMYWDLEGPYSQNKPSGHTSYQWGQDQAAAAYNAFWNGTYASYIGGWTIFADTEIGNNGYLTGSGTYYPPADQQVLQGWLDQIKSYNSGAITNGVYISPDAG